MDCRITKRRLSDFLAYEWIVIIALIVACVFAWEFVYSATAVRLTTGQKFKYYYDEGVIPQNSGTLYDLFGYGTSDSVFSYDILEYKVENLQKDYNILSVRFDVQDGDLVITEKTPSKIEGALSRAENVIKGIDIYDIDKMYSDSQEYLSQFLLDGQTQVKTENLDNQKIKAYFETRMKNDNRLRKGYISYQEEIKRIEDLVVQTQDFKKLIDNHPGFFYSVDIKEEGVYQAKQGRYGVDLGYLEDFGAQNKKPLTYYVKNSKITDKTSAKDVVLLVFNFKNYQPDLQYESFGFINKIVRTCSTLLD